MSVTLVALVALATIAACQPIKNVVATQCRPTPGGGTNLGTVRYLEPVFADVIVDCDLGYGPHAANTLDIYRPAGDSATERPLVVWFSSGGFIWTVKGGVPHPEYASRLARSGYVVAVVDYRVRPEMYATAETDMYHCPPRADVAAAAVDAFADGDAAVRWLRDHADQLGINPHRVATAGISAGGMTALAVNFGEAPGAEVTAAISLEGYGLDLTAIDAADGPTLLVHSRDDPGVPFACAQATYDRALAAGAEAELVPHNGFLHGFTTEVDRAIGDVTRFLYNRLVAS